MKTLTFVTAADRLLGHEGNYVNNPDDPGGETKFGISKRSYPDEDIVNLTRERALFLYNRDFWVPLIAVRLSVKFQAFDFAVNSGMQTAIRKLQQAIGVADDGYWGPISSAREQAMDESDVLLLFIAVRLEYWTSLSTWAKFGKGWARRAAANLRFAAEDN